MMRIAFIIPDKLYPWHSIHQGVGYVAAYAMKHVPRIECRVFRTSGTQDQELADFLAAGWDIVGLTLTTSAIDEARSILHKIKSTGSAKIVVGGSEVTSVEEKIFDVLPSIDFAISGEGEITFVELLGSLRGEGELSPIKGLIYRDGDGQIRKNAPRLFETDLEQFPYPDRTLFQYEYKSHSIIGTRGCPYRCTFCNSSSNWGHTYRLRKPQTVAEEIEYIIRLYGRTKFIAFNDDSFNINLQWVLEVCNLIKEFHVNWWIRGLRTSLVTEEVAVKLAESGCMGVACGVESANNEALKAMRKSTTIEEIMRGVNLLQAKGITVTGQFIIGNLGDTLETVKESIECARRFKDATFGIAYPIEHTYLFDFVKEHKYLLEKPVPVKYQGKIIDLILFDTPQFPVKDRLKAVDLAIKAKFYHNINYDAQHPVLNGIKQGAMANSILRRLKMLKHTT